MEEQRKTKKLGQYLKSTGLILLLGILLGVFLAFLDVDITFLESYTFLDWGIILLLFYIGLFLVINLHELGHLLVGKALGYELLLFRVGLLSFKKENGKLKVSLVKNVGYGGLCAMIPHEQSTLKDFALYSTGGVLMNILTGLGFLFLSAQPSLHQNLRGGLFLTGILSLIVAIINSWPFFSMNQPTDGMMFFSILGKSPLAERFYSSHVLTQKLTLGIRPRDLALEEKEGPMEDFHDLSHTFYLYFQALDQKNLQDAEKYLAMVEKNLGLTPPYTLPAYHYELCYFAMVQGDEEKAKKYHDLSGKILAKDQDINGLRIKAYYAYHVEKDLKKAEALARQGLAVQAHYPFKGQGIFEAEALNLLLEKIMKHQEEIC